MEVSTWSVLERMCVCVCVCVCTCTGLHLAYVCATQEEATATVYRHFVVCTAVNRVLAVRCLLLEGHRLCSVSYNGSKDGRAGYT